MKIEKIAEEIAGKKIELTMSLYGKCENIYFFGDGINNSLQILVDNIKNSYKAINNPLSDKESIQTGYLSGFQGGVA